MSIKSHSLNFFIALFKKFSLLTLKRLALPQRSLWSYLDFNRVLVSVDAVGAAAPTDFQKD